MLTIVAKQKAGDAFDEAAFAPIRDAFEKQVEDQSTALFATGRLWDDGIIDPRIPERCWGWRCPRRTQHRLRARRTTAFGACEEWVGAVEGDEVGHFGQAEPQQRRP